MQPCCFLSYNEDKPSAVLTASSKMQDHPKREQILSTECFGKGPYWVHLAQGKHKTEEVDRMTSWLTSSTFLVLYSLTGFQQPHVRDDPNCGDFSAPRENRQHSLHWGHTGCPDLSVALSRA